MKRGNDRQNGFVLMAILFLLALLTLAIMAAAPAMARRIQRERELETIQRGKQYARAIRMFYRKAGRYPNSVSELLDTNHLRFLRKEYKDPESDDGTWKLIHPGESQFKPTGFFGQSLLPAGSSPASAQTVGGLQAANMTTNQPGSQPAANTDQNAAGNQNASNQNASGNQPQDASRAFGSAAGNANNQTFGGGPIVGVAPIYKQKSLIVYNGKDQYNEWEFVYDPRMEQQMVVGAPGTQNLQGPNGNVQQQPNPNPNPGMMNQVPH